MSCANKVSENINTKKNIYNDITLELGKVSDFSNFTDTDNITVWGGSAIKGEDGLYHMFYSRWKKNLGWAWVTHSEIAHAVSTSPFGPFKHKDVVFPRRGAEYWDGLCTHNPTTHKFEGKYYLYYMGNTGDDVNPCVPGKIEYNWTHRNNQRIGVAVADNPNGPWKRFDEPLIDASEDENALDGFDWKLSKNPLVSKLEITKQDGSIQKLKHLERPQMFFENGKPIALFCAADTLDTKGVLHSWNVQIPIKILNNK
ncbi:hypothetical protein FUA26_06785 [Seonamhaeicola algicola]|uniref:Family 43 glycosylhydrolase n=1 Tax=Seonamhaeicola algicola TaxID=1719036 RepID=A0A5C7B2N2_9FLAO|nr:hypothetical protein FUA26_06785 [Seonamhaeicola algicola]